MENMLEELSKMLQSLYKDKLELVILYGSVARGTFTEDSDVDVMVLVNGTESELKSFEDRLCEISTDIALKYIRVISIVDVSYKEFLKWKDISPFYQNVRKEGVVLYAA